MFKKIVFGLLLLPAVAFAQITITPLAKDGIHDPNGAGFEKLQEPAEALTGFPERSQGAINWVEAYNQGLYKPRPSKTGDGKMTSVNLDIIMKNTGSMPHVLFSHKVHTTFLTCANCHVDIFLPKKGSNFISMNTILEGQHCGVCHGAVAFGFKDCAQCHSVGSKKSGLR